MSVWSAAVRPVTGLVRRAYHWTMNCKGRFMRPDMAMREIEHGNHRQTDGVGAREDRQ